MNSLTYLKTPYKGPQSATHHHIPPCQMTHFVINRYLKPKSMEFQLLTALSLNITFTH